MASEGESYRKREAPASIARNPKPPATPTIEPVDRPEPPRTIARAPDPVAVPPPAPAPAPTPDPVPAPAPPPPAVAKVDPKPAVAAPAPPPIDPFWTEPTQQKKWDLDHLTAEDERQLGMALNEMVLHFHPRLEVGPLPKRLNNAAKPYLKSVARKDVEYTFTVLDCPQMNVFSHPGGYVYVCKGLFDQIGDDEDYALEFIIAHEMAHVDLAHAIVCLKDPLVKKMFDIGTVPLFYGVPIPGGYLKDQEFEADRWAAERMLKLGRDRYQMLAFLRILEVYAKSNGFENYRKKPGEPPFVPLFDNHIRAHPVPSNRLES